MNFKIKSMHQRVRATVKVATPHSGSDGRRQKLKSQSEKGRVGERKGPGTELSRHTLLASSTPRSPRP